MSRYGALSPMIARGLRIFTAIVIGLAILWLLRWLSVIPFVVVACLLTVIVVKIGLYEGSWHGWWRIKLREWATDIQQLWLWVRLALKRERDDHDVAAMVHQQRFLDGRALSPVNLLGIAALFLFFSVGSLGLQEWRIGRLKRERDAPCSDIELSLRRNGEYRTSRASCAALGETNAVAREWMERAQQEADRRASEVASVRAETAAEIARQQEAAQRRAALAARQRRRENEGIEAALGGPAPDLELSLCELAGRVDCRTAGADGGGGGTPPADSVPPGHSDPGRE